MDQNTIDYISKLESMIDYNSLHNVGLLFTGNIGCTMGSMRFVKVRIISKLSNVKRDNQQWFNNRTWLARNQKRAERQAMRNNGTLNQYTGWL